MTAKNKTPLEWAFSQLGPGLIYPRQGPPFPGEYLGTVSVNGFTTNLSHRAIIIPCEIKASVDGTSSSELHSRTIIHFRAQGGLLSSAGRDRHDLKAGALRKKLVLERWLNRRLRKGEFVGSVETSVLYHQASRYMGELLTEEEIVARDFLKVCHLHNLGFLVEG